MTLTITDGRHDFDFFMGRWHIANRKLRNALERGSTDWVEFEATGDARPLLGGLGNTDTFSAPDMPDFGPFEGATLRLFDPETQLWRIWWMSVRQPGKLDTPMEGRFTDGHGVFFCDDVLGGTPVKVRFDWTHPAPDKARWEQSFSYDGGETWESNWVMDMTRDTAR